MARKGAAHWLAQAGDSVVKSMYESIPSIAAGLIDGGKAFAPAEPPPPKQDLEQFMNANPEERHAWLQSIPPEQYQQVTGQLMSEANHKYGAMASVLSPLFQLEQQAGLLGQMQFEKQSGMGQVAGQQSADAARTDLMNLLGVDELN